MNRIWSWLWAVLHLGSAAERVAAVLHGSPYLLRHLQKPCMGAQASRGGPPT